jgi:hypothetical protein
MPSTSGQSHEGWMSIIPLSVLVFIIMVALGGPESFVRTVTTFASDAMTYTARWVRSF